MADDLEAFLRQAAQRRAARKQLVAPRPAQAKPQAPSPKRQTLGQQAGPQTRKTEQPVVEAEAVVDPPSRLPTNINTSRIERHTQQLGNEVEFADDRLEARIEAEFDHDIGSFGDDSQATQVENIGLHDATSPADEIAKMLTDPVSLRSAIVLNEVFSPLRDRW